MTSLDPVFTPSNGSGVWLLASHCTDLGFDSRPVSAVYVVDKVALEQVFLKVFWFCLVCIFLAMFFCQASTVFNTSR
jgi:hypothetical protein